MLSCIQRYGAIGLLVVAGVGCDSDVSPLVKSYELESQTSLAGNYSAPLPPSFRAVFNGTNGRSMVVLSLGTQHIVALVDENGTFIRDVRVPALQRYILEHTQDKDGSVWLRLNGDRFGLSDFYRVDPDLNVTGMQNVVTAEEGDLFYSMRCDGSEFVYWSEPAPDETNSLLSKKKSEVVPSGQRILPPSPTGRRHFCFTRAAA